MSKKPATGKAKAATPKKRPASKATPTRGRPTLYQVAYAEQARRLALLGQTDAEMAAFFGVSESTFHLWKLKHTEFSESIKEGKEVADAKVAEALYQRAIGYSCPDTHVSNYQGEVTLTPITKHYPPDTTAMIFWLKNRQPRDWRDKAEVDMNVSSATPDELAAIYDEKMRMARERQAAVLRDRGLAPESDRE